MLNNYEADSLGATVARLGTGVAILSGFPLMFAGLKAALDGCFKLRGPARPATHGALLAAIASVAATSSEDDIGLIIELLGSTLGVAAAYVVPGLCAARSSALEKKHRRSGCVIAVGGMALCVGGTYLTLKTHAAGGGLVKKKRGNGVWGRGGRAKLAHRGLFFFSKQDRQEGRRL